MNTYYIIGLREPGTFLTWIERPLSKAFWGVTEYQAASRSKEHRVFPAFQFETYEQAYERATSVAAEKGLSESGEGIFQNWKIIKVTERVISSPLEHLAEAAE